MLLSLLLMKSLKTRFFTPQQKSEAVKIVMDSRKGVATVATELRL